MKRAPSLLRPPILAAGVVAGLVGAHALDYWLLISDPVRRQALLHSTGHAWIPQIESIAVACALASVVGALASGLCDTARPAPSIRATAMRLGAAQSLAFVTLEFGERIFAGAPLHHLSPLLLAVGVGLQIAVAATLAAAMVLLARASSRLAHALGGNRFALPRIPQQADLPARAFTPPRRVRRAATDPARGPPALTAS